jgi:hypothetical protein
MFAANSCIRQTFGSDGHRLRFLYSTVVEPIFSYGASVWISAMRTKAVVKKLRSFLLSLCRMITGTFRSAPYSSLVLLSNLLPIELRLLEIAACRFISVPANAPFAISAKEIICKPLPSLALFPKTEVSSLPHSANHPPWKLKICSSNIPSVMVPLLPSVPGTLQLFFATLCSNSNPSFAVVATDSLGIKSVYEASLQSSISHRQASCISLLKALKFIQASLPTYSSCNLFLSASSSILLPATPLYPEEVTALVSLSALGPFCHLFLAAHPSSAGFLLAVSRAKSPSICLLVHPTFSPKFWKNSVKDHLLAVWNNEWMTAKSGSTTRSFFPDVFAARSLLMLRSNVLANQLITGHCRLNHHLFRLGYAPAPTCDCGWPDENTFHFLFDCPRFSSLRGNLIHPLPVQDEEAVQQREPRFQNHPGTYPYAQRRARKASFRFASVSRWGLGTLGSSRAGS